MRSALPRPFQPYSFIVLFWPLEVLYAFIQGFIKGFIQGFILASDTRGFYPPPPISKEILDFFEHAGGEISRKRARIF